MNSAYAIESSTRTSGLGLGHRIRIRLRAALARVTSSGQPEPTREELALRRENQLMAERLLDTAKSRVRPFTMF